MRIGMMNNPRTDAVAEARWAATHKFELLDLTVEGPGADRHQVEAATLGKVLRDAGMDIVGHTGWYLPFDNPVKGVRRAAVEEAASLLPLFAQLGTTWVNVHIGTGVGSFPMADRMKWQGDAFADLAERAAAYGLKIMAEHPPKPRIGVAEIQSILSRAPTVGFHLDIGHAHVGVGQCEELIAAFADKLAHVHLSDNKMQSDDHLPLGAGTIDWKRALRQIHATGYDSTLTLEVFSNERDYLLVSAQKVREHWAKLQRQHAGGLTV